MKKHYSVAIELKDNGGFEGYGATFHTLDRHHDIIMPGAFKSALPMFLDENFVGGSGHDHAKPIGKIYEAYEDNKGLYVKAKYSDVEEAHKVRTLINDRVISKLSIGMELEEVQYVRKEEVLELWKSNGYHPMGDDRRRLKNAKDDIRVIHKATPLEVSPVTIPANQYATITAYKHAIPDSVQRYLERIADTFAGVAKNDLPSDRLERIDAIIGLCSKTLQSLQSQRDTYYRGTAQYKMAEQIEAIRLQIELQAELMRGGSANV